MPIARALLLVVVISAVCAAQGPQRTVEDNALVSSDLPKVRIRVDKSLKYLGKFDFNLRNIAAGERYVWAEAEGNRVKRMFVVQFEGFLPQVNEQYRFRMRTPVKLGRETYSHNLWFYNDEATRSAQPPNEAAYLTKFLAERNLSQDLDLMMSRFARIVGDDHRHEIIFFYWENLRDHGLSAQDFPDEEPVTPAHKTLGHEFYERSLRAFSVED